MARRTDWRCETTVSVRDEIIEAAARALWVCAYSDHVEEGACTALFECCDDCAARAEKCTGEDDADHIVESCFHDCPFGQHDKPGGGEDWMDYMPETVEAARVKARELIEEIEGQNHQLLDGIEKFYEGTIVPMDGHMKDPTPEDFGHYLAMQALGHGVSWADDHPDHGLELPLISFSDCDV